MGVSHTKLPCGAVHHTGVGLFFFWKLPWVSSKQHRINNEVVLDSVRPSLVRHVIGCTYTSCSVIGMTHAIYLTLRLVIIPQASTP